MKSLFTLLAGAALLAASAVASAQAPAYPARPVTLVVPYAPGGITDGAARAIAQKLGEKWKQPVVVSNRAGGGTTIGTREVAAAAGEGHTLLLTSFGFVMNQILMKSLPYDPKALVPLNMVGLAPNVLYLHPSVPAATLPELVAHAKAQPGALKFASSGNASSPHIAAELFGSLTATQVVHVAYRGTGPAMQDVLGGQVSGIFDTLQSMQYVKAGKLKPIAVAHTERLPGAPDVPTFRELGLPGMVTSSWFGFFLPSATPEALRRRIFDDIQDVLKQPDVRAKLVQLGLEPTVETQAEFQRFLNNEIERWSTLTKARNIQLD